MTHTRTRTHTHCTPTVLPREFIACHAALGWGGTTQELMGGGTTQELMGVGGGAFFGAMARGTPARKAERYTADARVLFYH